MIMATTSFTEPVFGVHIPDGQRLWFGTAGANVTNLLNNHNGVLIGGAGGVGPYTVPVPNDETDLLRFYQSANNQRHYMIAPAANQGTITTSGWTVDDDAANRGRVGNAAMASGSGAVQLHGFSKNGVPNVGFFYTAAPREVAYFESPQVSWSTENYNLGFVAPVGLELQIRLGTGNPPPVTSDHAGEIADLGPGGYLSISALESDFPGYELAEIRVYADNSGAKGALLTTYTLQDGSTFNVQSYTDPRGDTVLSFMQFGRQIVRIADAELVPNGTQFVYEVDLVSNRITYTLDPELVNKTGHGPGTTKWRRPGSGESSGGY